jgi:hypothetical protein
MSQLPPILKSILLKCKEKSSNWTAEPAVLQTALAKAKAGGNFTDEEIEQVKKALKAHME